MLVIFEGADGAGKGVLLRAFRSLTNFAHLEWDRGYLSRLVYSEYYKRPMFTMPKLRKTAIAEFKKFVRVNKPLIVYLKADPEVLAKRIVCRGEDLSEGPDPRVVVPMFERWLHELDFMDRVLEIDTTNEPDLEKLSIQIVKKINQLQCKGK